MGPSRGTGIQGRRTVILFHALVWAIDGPSFNSTTLYGDTRLVHLYSVSRGVIGWVGVDNFRSYTRGTQTICKRGLTRGTRYVHVRTIGLGYLLVLSTGRGRLGRGVTVNKGRVRGLLAFATIILLVTRGVHFNRTKTGRTRVGLTTRFLTGDLYRTFGDHLKDKVRTYTYGTRGDDE